MVMKLTKAFFCALLFCSSLSLFGQSTFNMSYPQMNAGSQGGNITFNLTGLPTCITSDLEMEVCFQGDLDGNTSSCPAGSVPVDEHVDIFYDGIDTGVDGGNTDLDPALCSSTVAEACNFESCVDVVISCNDASAALADGNLDVLFDPTNQVNCCCNFRARIASLVYTYDSPMTLNPSGPFCANDGIQVVSATVLCGYEGSFSGPGIVMDLINNEAQFDPAVAGEGIHTITFDNPCNMDPQSQTMMIEVLPQPNSLDIEIGINNVVCNNSDQTGIPLIGSSIPTDPNNVDWFGPGGNAVHVTDDGLTATFATDGLAPGIYTICADVQDDGGCHDPVTVCEEFQVVQELTPPSPVEIFIECQSNPSGSVSLSQLFPGIPNDVLLTATFTPNTNIVGGAFVYSDVGCFEINMMLDTGDPCNQMIDVTSRVFITEDPIPSFTMTSHSCYSAGSPTNSIIPTVTSPTYSSTVSRSWSMSGDDITGGTFDVSDGSFDVSSTGTMNVTLTETLTTTSGSCTGSNTCVNSYTQTIVVEDGTSLDPSFTASSSVICESGTVDLTATVAGGQFTGNGIDPANDGTDNGGDGTAQFSNSTPGIYQVDYTLNTAGGCSNVFSINIEVLNVTDASMSDIEICLDENPYIDLGILLTSGTTNGGTFSIVSSDVAGAIVGDILNYQGSGMFTIQYEVGNSMSCVGGCTNASGDDCYALETAILTIGDPCNESSNSSEDCIVHQELFDNSQVYIAGNCTGAAVTTCATYNSMPAPSEFILAGTPAEVGANSDFSEMDGSDDYVEVDNGQMSFNSINSVACFESSSIDISTYPMGVDWSIDLLQTSGTLEADDYIAVYQIVDGGMPTLVQQINNDFSGTQTVGNNNITGSSLQIQVCMKNGDTSGSDAGPVEEYSIDNFIVAGPPSADINDLELACDISPTGTLDLSALFDTETSSGGVFSFTLDGVNSIGNTLNGNVISNNVLVYDGPACLRVLYEVDCAGASAMDDAYILIREQPQPNYLIQQSVCWSDGDDPLTQVYTPQINSPVYASMVSRTWSVSGPASILNSTTGQIQITGAGTVQLTLMEEIDYAACGSFAAGSCSESYTLVIDAQDGTSQDASFTATPNPVCVNTIVNLTPATNGGVFTGIGVTDNGLGTGGSFSQSNAGTYQVDYTLNTPNGCTNVYSQNIVVNEDVEPPFWGSDASVCLCQGGAIDLNGFLLNNAPITGTFTRQSGSVASIISNTSQVNYLGGCGDVTFRYTVEDCDGNNEFDDITITFRECGSGSFDVPSSMCQGDSDYVLNGSNVSLVGCGDYNVTFSVVSGPDGNQLLGGSAVTSTISGFTMATIDPTVTSGDYIIEMRISDANGICSDFVELETVRVHKESGLPLSINMVADQCESAVFPISLTLQSTNDRAGDALTSAEVNWYGDGVNNAAGIVGSFNPPDTDGDGMPGPGNFLVCVDVGEAGCVETVCENIHVEDQPNIPSPQDVDLTCYQALPLNISLSDVFSASDLGGTYSIGAGSDPGATITNGLLTLNANGCFEVCYQINNSTCGNVGPVCANVNVAVTDEVEFDVPQSVCWDGVAGSLTVTPNVSLNTSVSRVWSIGTEGTTTTTTINAGTGELTINDVGVVQICLTEESSYNACGSLVAGSCTTTYCEFIEIFNSTNVDPSWSSFGPFCPSVNMDTDLDALVTGDINGVFSGNGVSVDGAHPNYVFNPSTAGVGIHTICYTINNGAGCTATDCKNIEVLDSENPQIICPTDVTVECGDPNLAMSLNTFLNGGSSTDNCDASPILNTELFGTLEQCGNSETRIYNFIATDASGNSSNCYANFVIEDTTNPIVTSSPTNLTIECDGEGNFGQIQSWLNNNGNAVASDNCGSVSWSNNYSGISNLCGFTGVAIVEFTVSDECGNTATTSATVTIEDTSNPSIVLPSDITLECNASDNDAIIESWLEAYSASDVCSTVTVTNDYGSAVQTDGCGLSGVTTVVFTVSDACGNTSTGSRTITIEDSTSPEIVVEASDLVLECGAMNGGAISAWELSQGGAMASDGCSDMALTWSMSSSSVMGCGSSSVTTYVFTVEDNCGNTSTTSASVIIEDSTSPVLVVPMEQTEECGNIQVDLPTWLGSASGSDACGSVSITSTLWNTIEGCGETREEVYLFVATDACGNTSSGLSSYILEDTETPMLVVPTDLTLECGDMNNDQLVLSWLNSAIGSDVYACGSLAISHNYPGSLPSVSCDLSSGVSVTWTISDGCGNSSMGSSTIYMDDSASPVFVNCPSDMSVNVDIDNCSSQVIYSVPVVEDGCSGNGLTPMLMSGIASGQEFPLGLTQITYEVSDGCGNTASCSFGITVLDSDTPSVSCPSTTVESCVDGGTCMWTSDGSVDANYGDNCTGQMLSHEISGSTVVMNGMGLVSGTVLNLGINVITYEVEDGSGNTSSCSFQVLVKDCESPTLTCSDMLDVSCGMEDIAGWQSTIESTIGDNCSMSGDMTFSSQLITDFSSCGGTIEQVYEFVVTDEAGNSSSCYGRYESDDNVSPVIGTMASDLTLECNGGNQSSALIGWLNNNGGASASDVCSSPLSWSHDYTGDLVGSCGTNGSVTVVFTVSDGCGNTSTTSGEFTIEDTTSPVLRLPSNIVLECGGMDNEAIIASWLSSAEGEDSCEGLVGVTNDYGSAMQTDGCGLSGVTTVVFTVSDACGNTSTGSRTITIEDRTSPEIVVEASDLVLECGAMNGGAISAWELSQGGAMASDDCSDMALTWSMSSSSVMGCGSSSVTTYVFTVEDNCGNTSTTSASVIIEDSTSPVLVVPMEQTEECGNIQVDLPTWLGSASGSDACGSVSITSTLWNTIEGCGETREEVYLFVATDACGNTSSGLSSYILEDTETPMLVVPTDLTLECGDMNNDQLVLSWLNSAIGSDVYACGSLAISHNYPGSLPSVSCDLSSGVSVTWTISDGCGNSSMGSSTIYMDDSASPVFVNCPSDMSVNVDIDNCSSQVIYSVPVVEDGCSGNGLTPMLTEWYSKWTGVSIRVDADHV